MTTDPASSVSSSIAELARACARQSSRRRRPADESDPCYELFRRAFASPPDEDAWQAIVNQYGRLVLHWLGQHANDDTCQEVFIRFWKTQQAAGSTFISRFRNTSAVMGYLRQCAVTVRIDAGREEERLHKIREQVQDDALVELIQACVSTTRGHADFDPKSFVQSNLKDERERVLFELMYRFDLAPREIHMERPSLFPETRTVYRVKENLLKRLRRTPELQKWLIQSAQKDGGGGNAAAPPV
jgi:DNA-directed RNA polymerase specialized sigma24 family protein